MSVNDLAVSKDGLYVVAVNSTGVYYFASENPDARWWYPAGAEDHFVSVAVSANGRYVVASNRSADILYFANSDTRAGLQTSATWTGMTSSISTNRDALDISDDGEYVAAWTDCFDGHLYYYNESTTKTGVRPWTWINVNVELVAGPTYLDLSADGRYIAVGGDDNSTGSVYFYKDANIPPFPTSCLWQSWSSLEHPIQDVKVSDDGFSVAAVSRAPGTLYYWANATNLYCDPAPTWKDTTPYNTVDIDATGDRVVTGKPPISPCGIHFWAGARSLTGVDPPTNWVRHEGEAIADVAISDNGRVIAAARCAIEPHVAYFYSVDGTPIGEYTLQAYSDLVSISGDGSIVAIGGSPPTVDSLYVLRIRYPVGGEILPTQTMTWLGQIAVATAVLASAAVAGLRRLRR